MKGSTTTETTIFFNKAGQDITVEPKAGETVYDQDKTPVGKVSAIVPLGENGEKGWAVEIDALQGLHAK
jgi:hypothetical protein